MAGEEDSFYVVVINNLIENECGTKMNDLWKKVASLLEHSKTISLNKRAAKKKLEEFFFICSLHVWILIAQRPKFQAKAKSRKLLSEARMKIPPFWWNKPARFSRTPHSHSLALAARNTKTFASFDWIYCCEWNLCWPPSASCTFCFLFASQHSRNSRSTWRKNLHNLQFKFRTI